jgi:OOP family OmpA-OmpF porin
MISTPRRALAFALLAGCSYLLSPAAAVAQEDPPAEETTTEGDDGGPLYYRFEFGLYGGAHFFAQKHGLREFSDVPELYSPKDAGVFGARFTLNLNQYVSLEGDGYWSPTRTRGRDPGVYTKMSVFGYRASVLIDFVGNGPFRPFVQLGAGGMSSIVDNEELMPNDQDPVVHGGLGFKVFFTPRIGIRADGIIMGPPAFASDVIKIGDETDFGGPDFQVLGTLFFNLSEVLRPSRQVIVKKETVVMQPPTPVDPDGDGLVGDADKCPTEPEDRDGFEDQDGCPDEDNDQDGIPDVRDRCPLDAEDKDNFEDGDGCPDTDNDRDGVLDAQDKCPNEPETRNGFQDDDGCPDELPPAIKKFTGVIEGITFKTGSANILPGSFNVLDRAVQVLKEYPEIKLEIQGHTDNRGKADYNRDLSQRRAESVRSYLVSRGIASDRLTAVGYGLDQPVADNASESGRSRNRRTEFKLIMAP